MVVNKARQRRRVPPQERTLVLAFAPLSRALALYYRLLAARRFFYYLGP